LSIIDLAGGTQPIPNEDETLWIVFRGDLQLPELREALVSRGTGLEPWRTLVIFTL
jgi:asparagine synthase (glutamine-hydrolysing)